MNQAVLELTHGRNNPRNSEGAFVTLKDGRIMYAYTRYYGKSWSDEASAEIAARYSDDHGRTWTKRDDILVKNEGKRNVMSVSLLRLHDGRIGLWYLRKNSLLDCRAHLRTSRDEGRTWSKPTLCIPADGYFVTNNDRVVQLKTGRLIVPASLHMGSWRENKLVTDFDRRGIAMYFFSDDAGKSWSRSQWHAVGPKVDSGLQEPGCVELKRGKLLGYSRTTAGYQYTHSSSDAGLTWTEPARSWFASPNAPLCIKRIPATGDLLAVWCDNRTQKKLDIKPTKQSWGRTPLVTALSSNEGRTWRAVKPLETSPSHGYCYTAIHFTDDDAVLLAYCCGGGRKSGVLQDVRVRKLSLDWLYGR